MTARRTRKKYLKLLGLIVLVIGLAAAPLVLVRNAEFGGADDRAAKAVSEISTGFRPWFAPIWRPPSQEIESLLFALQAAIGSGILCYGFGYLHGRNRRKDMEKK